MATIKLRRGTSSEWFAVNPVLADGEVGIESAPGTVPDKGKIGDGATSWNSLPYSITSDWVSLAERGVADGVASLDGSATVPDAQIPATIARDTEVTAAIASLNGTYVARSGGTTPAVAPLGYLNVKDFGALGDGRYVENCQITNGSPNIAMPGAALTNADVGKRIVVQSQVSQLTAGWYVGVLATTILSVTDAIHAVMAANATVTNTASRATWGTDDYAALQAAYTAAGVGAGTTSTLKSTGGYQVFVPPGMYLTSAEIDKYSQTKTLGCGAVAGHAHYEAGGSAIRAAAAMDSVFRLASTYGSHFDHVVVDGGNLATAVIHQNGYQNKISSCEIRRGTTYGVHTSSDAQGHENNIIDSVISMDARGTCVYTESCPDNIYMGNIMKGGTDACLWLKSSAACQIIGNHTYVLPPHVTLAEAGVICEGGFGLVFQGNYVDIVCGGPQMIVRTLGTGDTVASFKITGNFFWNASIDLPDDTYPHVLLDSTGGFIRGMSINDNSFLGDVEISGDHRTSFAVEVVVGGGSVTNTVFTDNYLRGVLRPWVETPEFANSRRPEIVHNNLLDQGGGGPSEVRGTQTTFDGTGSQTAFVFAHGLPWRPHWLNVLPRSADAMGHYYVTADATNITVTYDTLSAPPLGTDNVSFWYEAGI